MPKLSACLEMFWRDEPFEKRLQLAAEAGMKFYEFWGWSGKDVDALAKAGAEARIAPVICSAESERNLVDPGAGDALVEGLRRSAEAAHKLGVDRLIIVPGLERPKESFEVTRRTVVRNLAKMLPVLEKENLTLAVEPLNPVVDHPALWLTRVSDAADICYELDSPRVKFLFDIYHQQITEGNIIAQIREHVGVIGHFHCAGVPGRHELVGGELDYRAIFKAIDDAGYEGYVGLEFSPVGDAAASLREALSLVG